MPKVVIMCTCSCYLIAFNHHFFYSIRHVKCLDKYLKYVSTGYRHSSSKMHVKGASHLGEDTEKTVRGKVQSDNHEPEDETLAGLPLIAVTPLLELWASGGYKSPFKVTELYSTVDLWLPMFSAVV